MRSPLWPAGENIVQPVQWANSLLKVDAGGAD